MSILKEWQSKLLINPNVQVNEFLAHHGIDKLCKMDESTFKYLLEFHTKFSHGEQCQFRMDRVFEDMYYVDYPNADYLSHYLIYDDGEYWVFEHKCGRASFAVYRLDSSHVEYDDISDKYSLINWCKIDASFYIRLYDVEFTHQFLENILDKKIEFKRSYTRSIRIDENIKNLLR